MTTKQKADWLIIKAEYVNGTESVTDVAKRHNVSQAAANKRATREKWSEERLEKSKIVQKKADERLSAVRTEELAKFNEDDLLVARTIRSQVAAVINKAREAKRDLDAKELRSLAGAAEAAQRIGRLALGASTQNSEVFGKDGQPLAPPVFNFGFGDGGPGA